MPADHSAPAFTALPFFAVNIFAAPAMIYKVVCKLLTVYVHMD